MGSRVGTQLRQPTPSGWFENLLFWDPKISVPIEPPVLAHRGCWPPRLSIDCWFSSTVRLWPGRDCSPSQPLSTDHPSQSHGTESALKWAMHDLL